MSGCVGPRGRKKRFATYQDALTEFARLEELGVLRTDRASIYSCSDCEGWHLSSRRFTLVKPKGRGKRRRGLLEDAG
jgi:hypothetical protein